MPDPLAGLPPRFLRTPEAARFLGLSGRTLEKHRTYGTGPMYRKIGGRVVYALDDLQGLGRSSAPRPRPPIPAPERSIRPSAARCRTSPRSSRYRRSLADGALTMAARAPPTERANARRSIRSRRSPATCRRATSATSWSGRSSRSPRPRMTPILYRAGDDPTCRSSALPEHGMATIWDADVLIWAASQIVAGRGSRACRPRASSASRPTSF